MVQSNQSNQHTILPWQSFLNLHFIMCTFQPQSQLQSASADCQHGSYLKRFVSWCYAKVWFLIKLSWSQHDLCSSTNHIMRMLIHILESIIDSYMVLPSKSYHRFQRFHNAIKICIGLPRYAIICCNCRNAWKTRSNRKFNFQFVEAKSWMGAGFFHWGWNLYVCFLSETSLNQK